MSKAQRGLEDGAHHKELVPTKRRKLEFSSSNSHLHCHDRAAQPVCAALETSRSYSRHNPGVFSSGSCLRGGHLLNASRSQAVASPGEERAVLWIQPRHKVWLGNKRGLKGSLEGGLAEAVTRARFLWGTPGTGLGKAGERGSRQFL